MCCMKTPVSLTFLTKYHRECHKSNICQKKNQPNEDKKQHTDTEWSTTSHCSQTKLLFGTYKSGIMHFATASTNEYRDSETKAQNRVKMCRETPL